MSDSIRWKYLSFALMGLIVIGVLQPQAFAMTDSQLKKKLAEIWAAINGLTATTDDLQLQIDNIELTPGEDGLNCWDSNGDGVKDANEDTNNDGQWNTLDCQGPKGDSGENGTAGTNGSDGLHCWDLDGDAEHDASEDANDDGKWDALDCQGSSSGFAPNTRPIVDAGDDQTRVGVVQTGGCAFGICSTFNLLACQYNLAGHVQDDEFTGFLAHKWGPSTPASLFADEDQLVTQLSIAFFSPSPITSDLSFPVTLTADDGILESSDEIILTCEVPQ